MARKHLLNDSFPILTYELRVSSAYYGGQVDNHLTTWHSYDVNSLLYTQGKCSVSYLSFETVPIQNDETSTFCWYN